MDSYELEVLKSALRDVRRIDPQHVPRIVDAIRALRDNPFPPQHKKLKSAEASYRLRVGDYRVLYEVDTESRSIVVAHIRHRKDAYLG